MSDPELDATVQMWSHRCQMPNVGELLLSTSRLHHCSGRGWQNAGSCSTCPLTVYIYIFFLLSLFILFLQSCLLISSYQAGLLCWVIPSQAQNLVFVFAELHEVHASHFFQPVEVLLNSSPAPQYINCSLQFGVVHKFAESILHPIIQVINKYLGFDAVV